MGCSSSSRIRSGLARDALSDCKGHTVINGLGLRGNGNMDPPKTEPPPYSATIYSDCEQAGRFENLPAYWSRSEIEPPGGFQSTNEPQIHTLRLNQEISDLQYIIESDPELFMLFHRMFEEARTQVPPQNGESQTTYPKVDNYKIMLEMINMIIQQAPPYSMALLAGFPINFTVSRIMCTKSGQVAFLNEKINAQFKKILSAWAAFLDSPESANVLSGDPDYGWFSKTALQTMPGFVEDFECNPSKPHYGFCSWNDFFTRKLRPEARPIACPEDQNVIVNACESRPDRLASCVKAVDRFWVKGQPYSLNHMLAQDPLAPQFYGGTVYQAYLSQFSYHRWHSPVSGHIVKAYIKPGSYFSNAPMEPFDKSPPNRSQAYLTAVATRAIIFIKADNPDIGLMCFLPVGIAEVSSCVITVVEGQKVEKGQQLGMFRYGGSTCCLMFGPQTSLTFDLARWSVGKDGPNIPVNARIASVISHQIS